MTTGDLVGLVLRRWYLVGLGALVSLLVLWTAVHQPPVYFTQFDVVLLPPVEPVTPNTLEDPAYAMTPMAGLLVARVNGSDRPLELASAGTTLHGEGIRSGHRVRLRNWGTQWQPIYKTPVIDVQVVDADPGRVRDEATRLLVTLRESLHRLQADSGVRPASRMTLEAAPPDPVVSQVGGSRTRAAGAITLLGASLTLVLVAAVDRGLAIRRRRAGR